MYKAKVDDPNASPWQGQVIDEKTGEPIGTFRLTMEGLPHGIRLTYEIFDVKGATPNMQAITTVLDQIPSMMAMKGHDGVVREHWRNSRNAPPTETARDG